MMLDYPCRTSHLLTTEPRIDEVMFMPFLGYVAVFSIIFISWCEFPIVFEQFLAQI